MQHYNENNNRGDYLSLIRKWGPTLLTVLFVIAGVAVLDHKAFAVDIQVLETQLRGGVHDANPAVGVTDNRLPTGFSLQKIAQGTDPIENPSGSITLFGLLNTGVRTEPDESTYLVLDQNPGGPTAGFDYGRHFLFQGHENGADLAYVTRINLDVLDPLHRITLLTPVGAGGLTLFNTIDGSTWNPSTKTLLFTQESSSKGGVIEVNPEWGAAGFPRTLYGILGRGGYEGIHPDNHGNLIIIEDAGGTRVSIDPNDPNGATKTAANPNSFVYRFVPNNPADLSVGGKLQALQVSIDTQAVEFVAVDANHPFGDVFSTNQLKLHTLGTSWPVRWVTIHDTAINGTTEFNANTAAKNAGATPFKRPENAQFLPGSDFKTLFFDATGDTDALAGNVPALAARGTWGSIFRVDLDDNLDTGRISIVVLGDQFHAGFDNLTFADNNVLLAGEDRGDTLHDQLNVLDSVWAFDVTKKNAQNARLLALGRDPLAAPAGEEDNEPTGLHFSDGDASVSGMIGAQPLNPGSSRLFVTQQHGENVVWEILGSHLSQ
ncbi:MAG: alkaline phosphatase PhoX [Chloroflexota bacterium]